MTSLSIQMEAYAFRQLVAHLQWRTDVQNIDLMNLAGFCRNCLSKWYLMGAGEFGVVMDYAEATERVYGEPYPQWKKRHQKPASEEQLSAFEAGQSKHARTDAKPKAAIAPVAKMDVDSGGHSNVCGATCDVGPPQAIHTGEVVEARVAVLTVSDRASTGVYEDKSGPAIVSSLTAFSSNQTLSATFVDQKVVPDEKETIANILKGWSQSDCNLILTTGGTGFGPRDVTPEATQEVIARPAEGLSQAMSWQTSLLEPRSVLSRGVCGITDTKVLVVNLPGNPTAVKQCLSVLLPVLPHALRMLAK